MKLLIAYDGSSFADAAIEDLGRAGLPDAVEAVIISVSDVWELADIVDSTSSNSKPLSNKRAEMLRLHLQEVIEQSSTIAGSAADRVRERHPKWDVSVRAFTGKPATQIIAFADEWKPDLIVVGSHGRGFIGRALLGSVSMRVLYEARSSVRIARSLDITPTDPVRVLVAVDGSDNAMLAVNTVTQRSWPGSTEFRLITADDKPGSRPETSVLDAVPEGKEDTEEAKAWVEKVLKAPARLMGSAGFETSQFCRWGEARSVILDEAEEWKAGCIFIGARGLGRFHSLLLGSVSASIAARAACSVEVVRDVSRDKPQ